MKTARARILGISIVVASLSASPAAQAQPGAAAAPRLDMVFAIDATGSMGDEIDQVKHHLWSTVTRIVSGQPRPDLRVGLVIYRDRGDAEHTRVVPLTRDIDQIHRELMGIVASGGGDEPEDVDMALHLALTAIQWDAQAANLVFLIGDAPPQDYGQFNRRAMLSAAAERRIRIHTIQASGMNPHGRRTFSRIAEVTGGTAEILTYAQQVALADGRSVTTLRRGDRVYRARRVLSAEERAEGVDALASRGLVEAGDVPAASRARVARRPARRRGRAGGAATTAEAAPAAAPTDFSDTDVGGIISRGAMDAAEEMGVAY